jgi:hypothetical protein
MEHRSSPPSPTLKCASAERSSGEPWLAEDAARELPNLPLEDLLQLVHLYAERGSPKYEKAALRWLERYLEEGRGASHGGRVETREEFYAFWLERFPIEELREMAFAIWPTSSAERS